MTTAATRTAGAQSAPAPALWCVTCSTDTEPGPDTEIDYA